MSASQNPNLSINTNDDTEMDLTEGAHLVSVRMKFNASDERAFEIRLKFDTLNGLKQHYPHANGSNHSLRNASDCTVDYAQATINMRIPYPAGHRGGGRMESTHINDCYEVGAVNSAITKASYEAPEAQRYGEYHRLLENLQELRRLGCLTDENVNFIMACNNKNQLEQAYTNQNEQKAAPSPGQT